MEVQTAVRRRAPRHNAQFTREALKVVRPINRQIGVWQARVALLEALSRHRPGGPSEDVVERALALRHIVASQQSALAAEISKLPSQVAGEGRISDTMRALSTIVDGIGRIVGSDTAQA